MNVPLEDIKSLVHPFGMRVTTSDIWKAAQGGIIVDIGGNLIWWDPIYSDSTNWNHAMIRVKQIIQEDNCGV